MDSRIVLSDQFTIDTLERFGIKKFKGFTKESELFKYVDRYNDLFKDTIRNWYEMGMDHPFFEMYDIALENMSEDEYCMSKEEFDIKVAYNIKMVNKLIRNNGVNYEEV